MRAFSLALLAAVVAATASGADGAARRGVIVFASTRVDEESTDIWLLGSRLRGLTRGIGDDHAPALSPDRRTVAFVSSSVDGVGHEGRVVLISSRGAVLRPVVPGQGGKGSNPCWAPDSKRLVYQRSGALYVANVATRRAHRLTEGRDPAWSRDGRWIAFVDDRTHTISAIRPDGRSSRVLASFASWPPGGPHDLAWSPNGRSLAFSTRAIGDTSTISLLSVADGNTRDIVVEASNPVSSPTWSPDGRTIAYATGWGGNKPRQIDVPEAHFFEIWTVNVATEKRARLVHSASRVMNLDPDWR
jgi:Tol biopolymer transport system component